MAKASATLDVMQYQASSPSVSHAVFLLLRYDAGPPTCKSLPSRMISSKHPELAGDMPFMGRPRPCPGCVMEPMCLTMNGCCSSAAAEGRRAGSYSSMDITKLVAWEDSVIGKGRSFPAEMLRLTSALSLPSNGRQPGHMTRILQSLICRARWMTMLHSMQDSCVLGLKHIGKDGLGTTAAFEL